MTERVTLTINSDNNGSTSMELNSLQELSRLLQLSGLSSRDSCSSSNDIATDNNGAFEVEVGDDGSISMPTDENADYDYGRNPTSRKGFVYDVDPYAYQGDASDITRPVSCRSGDNPLRRVGESKSFDGYLKDVEAKSIKNIR